MENEKKKSFNYSLVYNNDLQKFESKSFYEGLSYAEMIAAMGSLNLKASELMEAIVRASLSEEDKKDIEKVAKAFSIVENDVLTYISLLKAGALDETKS